MCTAYERRGSHERNERTISSKKIWRRSAGTRTPILNYAPERKMYQSACKARERVGEYNEKGHAPEDSRVL